MKRQWWLRWVGLASGGVGGEAAVSQVQDQDGACDPAQKEAYQPHRPWKVPLFLFLVWLRSPFFCVEKGEGTRL